jgi:hypothetical protein
MYDGLDDADVGEHGRLVEVRLLDRVMEVGLMVVMVVVMGRIVMGMPTIVNGGVVVGMLGGVETTKVRLTVVGH